MEKRTLDQQKKSQRMSSAVMVMKSCDNFKSFSQQQTIFEEDLNVNDENNEQKPRALESNKKKSKI